MLVILERAVRLRHQALQLAQDPAIQFVGNRKRGAARLPTVSAGVHHEEAVAVPERQELAPSIAINRLAHVASRMKIRKVEILRGLLLRVDVAHHFGAERLRCLIKRDRVALGLVHLLAARIANERMAQETL